MAIEPSDIRSETSLPGMEPIFTWNCPGCNAVLWGQQIDITPQDIMHMPLCDQCEGASKP